MERITVSLLLTSIVGVASADDWVEIQSRHCSRHTIRAYRGHGYNQTCDSLLQWRDQLS